MPTRPFQILSLLAIFALILCQISLLLDDTSIIWVFVLTFPLLIPVIGLWQNRIYTYKWVGFLTMLYFSIGVSELVMNPELKIYGLVTTVFSMILFVCSIYHVRYLRAELNNKPSTGGS